MRSSLRGMTAFAYYVRRRMNDLGIPSQNELARRLGRTHSELSRWLTGGRSPLHGDVLYGLAIALAPEPTSRESVAQTLLVLVELVIGDGGGPQVYADTQPYPYQDCDMGSSGLAAGVG